MFTTLFVIAYCCSLIGSLHGDSKSINGSQYTIKNVPATYTQHVSNHGQCSIELNEQNQKPKILIEGEIIKIKNKWYKVEECRLNRAYTVPCGSELFYRLHDLACSIVDQHSQNKTHVRQQTKDELIEFLDRSYLNVCCENACTISELIQYCPKSS